MSESNETFDEKCDLFWEVMRVAALSRVGNACILHIHEAIKLAPQTVRDYLVALAGLVEAQTETDCQICEKVGSSSLEEDRATLRKISTACKELIIRWDELVATCDSLEEVSRRFPPLSLSDGTFIE